MLNSRQRAFLRKEASNKNPELQIGKEEIKETIYTELDNLLRTRELIKVSVLKTVDIDIYEEAQRIAEKVNADVVQVIGRKFVLYRFSKELAKKGKSIVLPK